MQPHLILHTRTHLQAGYMASNKYYTDRNLGQAACTRSGWPQGEYSTDPVTRQKIFNLCHGNPNQRLLMNCLNQSGETRCWQDLARHTSAQQCIYP